MYQHLVYGKSPCRQHQRQTRSAPALNSDLITLNLRNCKQNIVKERKKTVKYKKKPVVIEAFKYDGDLRGSDGKYYVPDWAVDAYEKGIMHYGALKPDDPPCELLIDTLEGIHHVSVGDYVIKGIAGELYPCKPDIFEESYELYDADF